MFASNSIRFALFSLLSLSANAETVRGAQRELNPEQAVVLGTAENYAILAQTGITTTGTTAITGNIAVSPITATSMTGFSLIMDSTNDFSTSTKITGMAYASDYVGGTTPDALTTAVNDVNTAYNDAKGRPNTDASRKNLGAGILGVSTAPLTPGVYTWSTGVQVSGDIYFDGDDDDIFIIQIAQTLVLAADVKVILQGGALAKNIYWQVAGAVTIGARAGMKGILLAGTSVTFVTGSQLSGRVLAGTACALDSAIITAPPTITR
jgi:hypothetical protein